ncbi:PREDICTED: olfactory receptor 5V1-like [Nanorana parkeri]|uniref:olfactory receptor 5V1-like n=1 Tax=Nanorana parkeri TaxID=125878 RepID=UPI000854B2D7|nr:PREDICTED: olfactory receptor 5V1-like [Nanorana parkeri]
MEQPNQTMISFFIIKGFSDIPELQAPIFLLVLFIYLLTLGGNMTIILLVCLDHHLHTPMYFFLVNLSFIDICATTVTLHKILLINLTGDRVISYIGCIGQMYVFGSLVSDELLFLTAMSYDRYVAVCNPLRYTVIMNHRTCTLLASVCWALGFIEIIPYVVLVTGFSCYRSNILNHFFCDLLPIIKLSCSNTSVLETLFIVEGAVLLGLGPFLLTFLSYVFIITTILKIRSKTGRRKAFYTCSSHLTVVILLYTTLIYQYLRPISADSLDYNKLLSLFNTAAVPILNPLIYSLKNKDVKSAFKKRLQFVRVKNTVVKPACIVGLQLLTVKK